MYKQHKKIMKKDKARVNHQSERITDNGTCIQTFSIMKLNTNILLCKHITSFVIQICLKHYIHISCSTAAASPAHLYHQGSLVDVAPPENSGSDGESKTESEERLVGMLNNEVKGMGGSLESLHHN